MAEKRVPVRQCIGCREHFPKIELVRVVRSPSGELCLDTTGKKPGRGAYLCKNPDCLKRARKARAIERALGGALTEQAAEELTAKLGGTE